ncbi:TPA: Gfo/Idh/MocA family oxidoreductase [Candidatus Poribacteria bacterium]|nr:Gfo/Idh/MocA family oxidoreductase [Candidatus Poribacteria bacterium]
MINLGIVDFDTSHVVAFTQRLNHIGVSEEQWVDGAKIVIGCPGESIMSPERIPEYTKTVKEFGVELVDKPEDIIGKVDGVLVESVDGSVHYERAKPFIEAGLPTYIDKPFACSVKDAKALVELADKNGVPLFSSSSLRYALEIVALKEKEGEIGKVIGADTYSPASLSPRNPGLFNYGIHAVEPLYALMGPGCESVRSVSTEGVDVVTGLWKDGRVGVVRGIRAGSGGFGFTAFCEKSIQSATIDSGYIYRELLKRIVEMFQTGKPPIDISETVEIVAFIEAANKSGEQGAKRVSLF